MAELIISHGGDVNSADRDGITPLHLAALAGYGEFMVLLVSRGACVTAKDCEGVTPLQCAESMHHEVGAEFLRRSGA
jgi:ankyrin repeat protein